MCQFTSLLTEHFDGFVRSNQSDVLRFVSWWNFFSSSQQAAKNIWRKTLNDVNQRQGFRVTSCLLTLYHPQVIEAHFYLKKDEILKQCEQWTKETESLLSGRPVGRAISHHVQSLKQNSALLKHELDKLQPPSDHKQQDGDSDEDSD